MNNDDSSIAASRYIATIPQATAEGLYFEANGISSSFGPNPMYLSKTSVTTCTRVNKHASAAT